MEVGLIRRINIDNEMQASYLDYAMSVIVARALPDVRDGLKPVHRRILYAMQDMGLTHDKPYKKSARIVGEVLGKYHPHGDAAVYEAMVRMAQDFSLRYPLVDGQGNFGSVDGDNAAAMRYTEARLAAIAGEMLADIDKDTVDWNDNFDGTLKEPSVLPAALPNLLVNGSSGIAVGMATNIPPHNLGEVCDALCYLIDRFDQVENVNTDDLMRFIQGPDFPTGGVVFRYEQGGPGEESEQVDAIERAYGSGRGSLVVQAKAHIEEMSRSRSRIVVTELPYQTDKSRLIERIAELVRDGRLEGITDLRDESDRTGMRLCIEMTRTVDPRQVLADLYKLTPLQSTFGVSLLALVDGEPRLLGLKKILQHFIEHRREVILRRSRFELKKAQEREHILAGLLRALDVLDEIIALIRRSRTADAARLGLIREFHFDEVQAQAILDMQLRRLAALERQKLQDEYKQVVRLIGELEELIRSPKKILALIKQNLIDLKARYGDARRTQIAERVKAVLTAREHAVERNVWVSLSADGRLMTANREAGEQGKRGRPSLPQPLRAPGAAPALVLAANTRQDVYLFSADGRAARVLGHQLPEGAGTPAAELIGSKERVVAMFALAPDDNGGDAEDAPAAGYLALGTALGKVKRVALADLVAQAHTGPIVIGLDAGDELAWAAMGRGEGEMLLVTAGGQAIRFAEEDVRPMGLPAGGVGGIKLREGDRVVAGLLLAGGAGDDGSGKPPKTAVALVTQAGFGKQVSLGEFPVQGRFGGGVVAAKILPKSGKIAGAALLAPDGYLVCLAAANASAVLQSIDLPAQARAAQGKAVPALVRLGPITTVYTVKGGLEPPSDGGPNGGRETSGEDGHAPTAGGQAGNSRSRRTRAEDSAIASMSGPVGRAAKTQPRRAATGAAREKPAADAPVVAPTRPATGKGAKKATPPAAESAPVRARPAPGKGARRAGAPADTPPVEPPARKAAAKLSSPPGESRAAGSDSAKTAKEPKTPPANTKGRRGTATTAPPAAKGHAPATAAGLGVREPKATAAQPKGRKGAGAKTPSPVGESRAAEGGPANAAGAPETPPAKPAGRTGATGRAAPAAPAAVKATGKPAAQRATAMPAPEAKEQAKTAPRRGRAAGASAPEEAGRRAAQQAPAAARDAAAQLPLVPPGDLPPARRRAATGSNPEAAGPATPPSWPRAKHSAADGPMTWPLVPPGSDDDEPDAPPRRGR